MENEFNDVRFLDALNNFVDGQLDNNHPCVYENNPSLVTVDMLVFIEARTYPSLEATRTNDTPSECIYCLDKFNEENSKNNILMLHCCHLFHKSCVADWVLKNNRCPVCRQDAYENGKKDEYKE